MREILFRGKRVDNGEWVYGDLLNVGVDYDYAIRTYGGREHGQVNAVNEKTVGQYTGLTDKNGKKIFEGDIVESTSDLVNLRGEKTGKKITKFYEVVVIADNSSFTYGTREIGETYISRTIYKENAQRFYSVIGNIHDTPELLEVR